MGSIIMSKRKHSTEEKVEAVERYLRGESTLITGSQEIGIGISTFHEWISKYQTFGIEGLRAGGKQFRYTQEIMYAAVKEYLSSSCSQDEICRKYKSGVSVKVLAEEYALSVKSIQRIIRNTKQKDDTVS